MDKNLVNLSSQVFAKLPSEGDGGYSANFQEVKFKYKKLAEQTVNSYKIYKNAKEFALVEAESAAKALEMSGIKEPYKIIRATTELNSVIGKNLLSDG